MAGGQSTLEIFPEHHLARITTPTSRLELFGSPAPRIVNGQVVISRENGQEPHQTGRHASPSRSTGTWQEELNLSVSPEGAVVFGYVACPTTPDEPQTAPETTQEPSAAAPAGDGRATADTPPEAPLNPVPSGAASDVAGAGIRPPNSTGSPPDTPPPAVSQPDTTGTLTVQPEAAPANGGRPADRQTKEQQPRVQLTGRLGRDPSFRTSPRGTLVGRFPLAVHRDDGTTVWHSVLAFGDRAKLLQHRSDAGELAKGQEVNLIGYEHTREQPTRDGHTKKVTEIYAVAVTRR